ncbi:hypothetical protein [Microlunatus soli]|nr:hypothetical protein [Microlunatus soli]
MTDQTERCWLFDTLAVTVAWVDFHDPAMADRADARERGVRVEIRPMTIEAGGSVYASPAIALAPAVCRIDLLESAPDAADRMHWHPVMIDGEPDDREYVPRMGADPAGWLAARLAEVDVLLQRTGVPDDADRRAAAAAIARSADEIVDAARAGLDWARQPWPQVERDVRGMAVSVG